MKNLADEDDTSPPLSNACMVMRCLVDDKEDETPVGEEQVFKLLLSM